MNDAPGQRLREHDNEMGEYYRARTFWQSRANLRELPHTLDEDDSLRRLAQTIRRTYDHHR